MEKSKHCGPVWIMTLSSRRGGMKKQEVHSNSTECLFCGQSQISSAVSRIILPNVSFALFGHWLPIKGLIHYSERLWYTLKDPTSVWFGLINYKIHMGRVPLLGAPQQNLTDSCTDVQERCLSRQYRQNSTALNKETITSLSVVAQHIVFQTKQLSIQWIIQDISSVSLTHIYDDPKVDY